jgi:hypothetical protein
MNTTSVNIISILRMSFLDRKKFPNSSIPIISPPLFPTRQIKLKLQEILKGDWI